MTLLYQNQFNTTLDPARPKPLRRPKQSPTAPQGITFDPMLLRVFQRRPDLRLSLLEAIENERKAN